MLLEPFTANVADTFLAGCSAYHNTVDMASHASFLLAAPARAHTDYRRWMYRHGRTQVETRAHSSIPLSDNIYYSIKIHQPSKPAMVLEFLF